MERSFSSHHLSTLGFQFSTLVPSLRSGRRIASRIPPGHFERAGGRSVNFQFGKMQFTCFRRATFEITVYSFSRRDFLYCNLLVFVALLSKLHFTSFEIVIYSFSWRYFRSCSLLIFVGRLAILQLIRFRGANFEIEVYSLSLPKSFPIDRTL